MSPITPEPAVAGPSPLAAPQAVDGCGHARRQWLLALAALGLIAPAATAGAAAAAGSGSPGGVLADVGATVAPPGAIRLAVADSADNGASVPVVVESLLADTTEILLLADINPVPIAVRFEIPPGTDAFVATRLKLAASGPVHAVVRAQGRLLATTRDVTVAVGGCG
ncbi:MAG: thiosulfate oxidation carrier protein SoxY [Rubrivivax sp.]|jgi:sulfur-oxidizing protein SoxY|nr:thiosulfate oxidation carrier protein SoxY [Rubrivivax sp.]